jgi:hypothetical protein
MVNIYYILGLYSCDITQSAYHMSVNVNIYYILALYSCDITHSAYHMSVNGKYILYTGFTPRVIVLYYSYERFVGSNCTGYVCMYVCITLYILWK